MEIPVSSVLLVLLVLLVSVVFSTVSAFERSVTTVRLHEAATLQCFKRCSGLVKWTQARKQDVLAQCDQTSCQSQEGYQMSHDEYLKGNLSLTITDADFSKRTWYTCQCDGEAICDVSLRLKPFSKSVKVQDGEDLSLNLPISDDVEVTFNRSDSDDVGTNTLKLCTVEGHKAECESSYGTRVSVGFGLQLKKVKKHDGGVYIIRDTKNDEVIGTYPVTVSETHSKITDNSPAGAQQDRPEVAVMMLSYIGGKRFWGSSAEAVCSRKDEDRCRMLLLLVGLLIGMLVVTIPVIVVLIVKNRQLQKRLRQNQPPPINMQHVQQYSPVKDEADGPVTDEEKQNGDLKAEGNGHLETVSLVNLTSVTHSS